MHEFKIGDKVRIRQWDDMEAEFGLNGLDIQCNLYFIPEMRHLCGVEGIVRLIHEDEKVELITDNYDITNFVYFISTDMLELMEEQDGK